MSNSKSRLIVTALSLFLLIGLHLTISARAADTSVTVDLAEGSVSIEDGTVTCGESGGTTYSIDSSIELIIIQTDSDTTDEDNPTSTTNNITVNDSTDAVNITLSGVNISSSGCAFELTILQP